MKDDNCVFCKIISGSIPSYKIWEDEKFFAFLDITPLQKGHTLIIPKNHTDYLFDLYSPEYEDLFLFVKHLAKNIKVKIDCKRVGLIVEGFGVSHAHIHLVPINYPDQFDSKLKYMASKEELEEVQKLYTN